MKCKKGSRVTNGDKIRAMAIVIIYATKHGVITEEQLLKEVQSQMSFNIRPDLFANNFKYDPMFQLEHEPGIGFKVSLSSISQVERAHETIYLLAASMEQYGLLKNAA